MKRSLALVKGLIGGGIVINRGISHTIPVAITLLITCCLLLSGVQTRGTYAAAAAAQVGYDYTARIDWLRIIRQRSKNGDNDWMVYEVRVVRNGSQVFYDKRDGQLAMDKPLTSIKGGDFIGLTDQQNRWSNPFVMDFVLQDSDVVIGTYTIVNQSHENYDPDAQRKKWDKFVNTEGKSVTLSKLIALPIGVGPLAGEVGDLFINILNAIGDVWDLVSPPLGHNVSCDGPIVSGYWKFTGADLVRLTNNSRRIYATSQRQTSGDKPASECGAPPETEVGISIERSLNMAGNLGGSGGSSVKTTSSPVTGAPASVWLGEWVEKIHVKDSRYDVWIGRPARQGPRGLGYQVIVRELATPGSAQVVFKTEAQGLMPAPLQLPSLRLRVGSQIDLLDHVNNPLLAAVTPVSMMKPPNQGSRRLPASADALEVGNGVTLYLYQTYSNNSPNGYSVRYFRLGAVDVFLRPAQKPLQ